MSGTPTFPEMDLPAPLAEAIAARGYETPTAVQAAVAEGAKSGRDMLVSSETGSGKTLAFGVAIADMLLKPPAPRDAESPAPRGTARHAGPRALIITPTRELATQVRDELAWLYAKTNLKIAAFTGGTDVRGDLMRLRPGVDLAVGTPGRLVDLFERKNLRLDAVEAFVLDEADEMLDMGFRDDLETLLAPRAGKDVPADVRARTLMFSATLPATILSLAARYQRDAQRIDARSNKGDRGAHQDISYVAHLVAMGERVPAVVNVLRQHKGVRAIVFGTTRDGVAELHQQLNNRGFRAVVLSGDRAQAERTRALGALKTGKADVLVATNVAARGLDLPEVDLVIHADLPLNTEALTHRSGRTGRAGRKGTSVLIATLADRRKAERLLGNARITFTWTAAPGAREIAQASGAELATSLIEEARASEAPEAGDARELAARLAQESDRDALLVALLRREMERMPTGEALTAVDLRQRTGPMRPEPNGPRPTRGEFSRGSVVFSINIGANQKAEPGWLLPLICRRGGVTRHDVGAIRVGPQGSEFEISGQAAEDFALSAGQSDPRAPHVRIQRVGGASPSRAPRSGAPSRAPRHEGPARPAYAERVEPPAPAPVQPPPPVVHSEPPAPPIQAEKPAKPAHAEKPARPAHVEKPAHAEKPAKPAHVEKPAKPAHVEKPARPAHAERPSRAVPVERAARPAFNDRPQRPARDDRPARPSFGDRPARPSFGDRPARPSFGDRPARPSFGDRPARPSHGNRPARPASGDGPPRAHSADGPPRAKPDGRAVWRPPARQQPPAPQKAGTRRPPRPR